MARFREDKRNREERERREAQKDAYRELNKELGRAPSAGEVEARIQSKSMWSDPAIQIVTSNLGALRHYIWGAGTNNPYLWYESPVVPKPLAEELTIIDAIIGWRRWSVTMFGKTLMSNNGVKWQPFEKLTAECKGNSSGGWATVIDQPCGGIHCSCGIYAYKDRVNARHGENAPSAITHVWGQVYLWGRVVEHESGWRAQYAYPKALVDDGGIARQMAAEYGIETIPVTAEDQTPPIGKMSYKDALQLLQTQWVNVQQQIVSLGYKP